MCFGEWKRSTCLRCHSSFFCVSFPSVLSSSSTSSSPCSSLFRSGSMIAVLYLYVFPQTRHFGWSLSQTSDLFLWRSSTQNVLRTSSSPVSCSGGSVWSFCISPWIICVVWHSPLLALVLFFTLLLKFLPQINQTKSIFPFVQRTTQMWFSWRVWHTDISTCRVVSSLTRCVKTSL